MPSTPILHTVWGALSKLEASYGAGASVTAGADGQLLAEECVLAADFLDLGKRTADAGTTGQVQAVAPSGKFGKTKLKVEARGLGATYDATHFPPDWHLWMRAAGHLATLNTGAYIYTPQSNPSGGYSSAYLELYPKGLKFPLTGAVCDLTWTIAKPGVSIFEFDFSAIGGTEAETALPSITYLAPSIFPPKANNIALAIGAYSVARAVKTITFKAGRAIAPRTDINAGGHGGFALGDRKPTVVLELEREALGTFNPYVDRDAGTSKALSWSLNGGTNNKLNFLASQAQLVKIEDVVLGEVAGWKLTYDLATSTSIADDDYSITAAV